MASGVAKGVVLAKQTAAEKISKVALSEEKDTEIVSALQSLKRTKNTVTSLSAIVRNLYEAKVNEATYLTQLADTLQHIPISADDPFGALLERMGSALSALEQVQSAHLERMEEQLVRPLEHFLDAEVAQAQRLKLKYKNGKTEFDVAAHRLSKADGPKALHAAHKRDAALEAFSRNKLDLKSQIERVEQVKQGDLLCDLAAYWESYAAFAQAQSNILSSQKTLGVSAPRRVPPAPRRSVVSALNAMTARPTRPAPPRRRAESVPTSTQIEGLSEHAAQSKPTIAKGTRRKRSRSKRRLVPVDSVDARVRC